MARDLVQGLKYRKPPEKFNTQALAETLEKAYMLQAREPKHTQKYSFSPSTIGYGHGTCPRYWYHAFTGGYYEDTADAQGIANMSYGSSAHERIEKLFKDAGVLINSEVEIKMSDPPVRGFADVLIRWDGEVVIGEIKTTRQEMFAHRQTTMKPTAYHLYQILLYMKATNKRYGFLLYENKNNQQFLIIPVEMTEENEKIIDDALDWMRMVHNNWKEEKLPARPFTKRNKICKNCPFFKVCWEENEDGDEKLPVMEVAKP